MDCGCDPSKDAYDEVAAKWRPAGAGIVQHFVSCTKRQLPGPSVVLQYLKAVDVVTISKVTVSTDAPTSDSWTPGFLKVIHQTGYSAATHCLRADSGQHERHADRPRKRHLLHGHWQKGDT